MKMQHLLKSARKKVNKTNSSLSFSLLAKPLQECSSRLVDVIFSVLADYLVLILHFLLPFKFSKILLDVSPYSHLYVLRNFAFRTYTCPCCRLSVCSGKHACPGHQWRRARVSKIEILLSVNMKFNSVLSYFDGLMRKVFINSNV